MDKKIRIKIIKWLSGNIIQDASMLADDIADDFATKYATADAIVAEAEKRVAAAFTQWLADEEAAACEE